MSEHEDFAKLTICLEHRKSKASEVEGDLMGAIQRLLKQELKKLAEKLLSGRVRDFVKRIVKKC